MSKKQNMPFECSKCGTKNTAETWTHVTVDEDPELRDAVLNGTLFSHKCEGCGEVAGLIYPCLYHDHARGFMIYLIPDAEKAETFTALPLPPEVLSSELDMSGYKLRVAESVSALVEKIHLLEAGLDDRAAEVCKLLALGKLQERRSDYLPAATHFERREDKDVCSFISASAETAQVYLPSGLDEDILKTINERDNGTPRFELVNLIWAKAFVNIVRSQNQPPQG